MTRVDDRRLAIKMRMEGATYNEIKRALDVPKSTLSNWLATHPLTEEQILAIAKRGATNRYLAIEKIRATKKRKRQLRLDEVYQNQSKYWLPLTERELILAGLFLYWGEGSKYMLGSLSLTNTDPSVLQFTLAWLNQGLKVPKEMIKIYLHLYSDMDINKEKLYWSEVLKLPLAQFGKPYIKQSSRALIDQKGYGHGTCALIVNDIRLKEKVMMSIRAIADSYGLEGSKMV